MLNATFSVIFKHCVCTMYACDEGVVFYLGCEIKNTANISEEIMRVFCLKFLVMRDELHVTQDLEP